MPTGSAPSRPVSAVRARLDFPLCGDCRYDEPVRGVLDRCVGRLLDRIGPQALAAVVLAGSFARGEGSVMRDGQALRVLGDIELLVVVRTVRDYHRVRRGVADWSREVSRAVSPHVRVEIEFGPVDVTYLRRRALPSIFVHDLIQHGKVLWGHPDIVLEVPRFGAGDIPREDAVHLVFNRLIEELEAYDRLGDLDEEALWHLAYHRLKLVLDLAGSALAFTGRHEASYARRPHAFAQLLTETPALARALPSGFTLELAQAARLKLAPDGREVMPAAGSLTAQRAWVRDRIVSGIPAVTAVLNWELVELFGRNVPLPELLRSWRRRSPARRRARDWAKVALHPVPAPLPLAPVRAVRLALGATPRALLYSAGTLAYVNLDAPTASPGTIGRLLFVRGPARHRPDLQRRAITALWRWCVRNT